MRFKCQTEARAQLRLQGALRVLDLDWNSFSDPMRSPRISAKRSLICWAKAASDDVTLGRESAKNAHNDDNISGTGSKSATSSWRR
jgi:hypothetical protein